MNRLDRAAEICGQSKQAYVQAAVLAEVAGTEERNLMKELPVSRSQKAPRQEEVDLTTPTAAGFDISEKIRRRDAGHEMPAQSIPQNQQGQVVVNVGGSSENSGGARGSSGLIDGLADFVVAGHDFERTHRLRSVVGVLCASASTDEERKVLAARLDEAVALKTKTNNENSEGIVHTARMTFEKLSNIWRG